MHLPPGRLARGSMAARPVRRPAAPVAALDPSAVDALYQVQEFGLTIMGVGIVSTFAAGMAHSLRRATATYTATAAATVAAEAPAAAPAAAAALAPAPALEQQPAAAAVEQRAPVAAPAPAAPVLELSDLKSELQQAAAAAVAAVKSAAAAEPAPPVKPAPAAAPAPTASGAAVKPGLTVEEATQVRTRGTLGRLGLAAGCAVGEQRQPGWLAWLPTLALACHPPGRSTSAHGPSRPPACSKSRTGSLPGKAEATASPQRRWSSLPVRQHPPPA